MDISITGTARRTITKTVLFSAQAFVQRRFHVSKRTSVSGTRS
jgi:hypothetical protein